MALQEESLYETLWPEFDAVDSRPREAATSWVSGISKQSLQSRSMQYPAAMRAASCATAITTDQCFDASRTGSAPYQMQDHRPAAQFQGTRPVAVSERKGFGAFQAAETGQSQVQFSQLSYPQGQDRQSSHAAYLLQQQLLDLPQQHAKRDASQIMYQVPQQDFRKVQTKRENTVDVCRSQYQMQPHTGGLSCLSSFAASANESVDAVDGDVKEMVDKAMREFSSNMRHELPPQPKDRSSMVRSIPDELQAMPPCSDLQVSFPPEICSYGSSIQCQGMQGFPPNFCTETATSSTGPALMAVKCGSVVKHKQRRRYAKPKSSKYCHLCARHVRAVRMYPCGNLELGICQKSVCGKCFETYNLDLAAAERPRTPGCPAWTCPHCQNACPEKAKCHSYDRQTERRRMKTREAKLRLAALPGQETASA